MKSYTIVTIALLLVSFCSLAPAQWVQTSGPFGGVIECFATNGTNLFAGAGGVFLSTNNGTSWATTALTNREVLALAVSGTNLFAGTYGGGVFLSTNNGTSWTAVNAGLTDTHVGALAMSPNGAAGTYLLAGTDAGIFLSTNDGTSWTRVFSWDRAGPFLVVPPHVYAVIFAGGEGGGAYVCRSTNHGMNWSADGSGMPEYYASIPALAASPNGEAKLFAAENTYHHIYHSTNNGSYWAPIASTSDTILSFAVSPSLDTSIGFYLFAGTHGRGILRSLDNGATWTEVNDGLPTNTTVNVLIVHDPYLFAGTDRGVWRRRLSELITSVGQNGEVPLGFVLEQNYPNPFNPSTRIRYSLPSRGLNTAKGRVGEGSLVTLRVYDLLGREVTALVNETKSPGTYEVQWNAEKFASGVYYYRLQAGDFVQTKKLMLLR